MGKAQEIAVYITICCVAFIISKTIIAVLLYKRWKTKHFAYGDGFSGGKMILFKSAIMQSLNCDMVLKKTMKLNNKDIIGRGGYGTVYRLMINDSMGFAVKRLNRGSEESDRGFERELEAMGDIKHRNIVTLHGYYTASHYNLLIYELMPNGSLDSLLHGRSMEKRKLDWESRYNIAIGAARGIAYMHHDCIPHIIHRDIKSSNILLDQNMEARVSDFGLATLMEPDKTHVSTFPAGTFGYLAPEYLDSGKATAKGDVYSFGVVLLELLTGKRPTDEAFLEEGTKLVTWVKGVVEDKREEFVVDESLKCSRMNEINKVFRIALLCLESDPAKRPTMTEIFKMLEHHWSNHIVLTEAREAVEGIVAALWRLWLYRNGVWRNERGQVGAIFAQALASLQAWQGVRRQSDGPALRGLAQFLGRLEQWFQLIGSFPDEGFVKCNVDGTCFSQLGWWWLWVSWSRLYRVS